MIMSAEIAEAIRQRLVEKFPETAVYINGYAKDIAKPCFCIQVFKTTEWPANRNSVKIRIRFRIRYHAVVDENGVADTENLMDIQSEVMTAFRLGYVKVGDRNLTVTARNHGTHSDFSCVDLRFDYFDDRPDESVTVPNMGEVTLNLNKGE